MVDAEIEGQLRLKNLLKRHIEEREGAIVAIHDQIAVYRCTQAERVGQTATLEGEIKRLEEAIAVAKANYKTLKEQQVLTYAPIISYLSL